MTRTTWASLRRRLLAFAGALAIAAGVLVPTAASSASEAAPAPAVALSGSQFIPGNIISDQLFYQSGAMSASEIQAFLDAKIGNCTNTNCLNVYVAKTEARSNDRNICTGYTPDSDARERVSTIIYKVQQACGISAKVILVMLQKEQGLVTHQGPTTGRLGAAMGWLCPDTAPCDSGGASLFRQIYGGAWQLKRYNTPDLFGNFHIGTYRIQYHPDTSCGSKTVTITNDATAALYNYTPYTPNSAALANLTGSAPPCGSYGNRNFWVFYSNWFGSPIDVPFNAARTPVVSGTAAVGATLTVAVGNWSPVPTFSYQWLRDGVAIPGATASTYVLTEADDGHTLSIQVTGTAPGRVTAVKTSAGFLFGAAFTTAGVPTISGEVGYGTTLTGISGAWAPEPGELQYQWLRDGVEIAGATSEQYTTGPADRGHRISFRVTALRDGYVLTARESVRTQQILDVLTTNTPSVRLPEGVPPTVGQTAEAIRGKWYGGGEELVEANFSYTWYRDGALINNQTSKTYQLRSADAGTRISVKVTARMVGFVAASETSGPTGRVGLALSAQTPVIDGVTAVGQTLTSVRGTWTSGTSFTYQWLRGGTVIAGATAETYTLVTADLGQAISLRVTGAKSGYSTKSLTSAATSLVSADMVAAATPTITGAAVVGETLTASAGAWGPDPVTLQYTWRRGTTVLQSGASASYQLTAADAGATVKVTVTGSKSGYATVSATSAATPAVLRVLSGRTPYITFPSSGLGVGATLTAVRGQWYAGSVALPESAFTYTWYRNGVKINNQTEKTYKTRSADLGATITVTVTARRSGYQSLALTSPPTAAVPQVPVKALTTTAPRIEGTPGVGVALSVAVTGWTSGTTFSYQWYRDGEEITDATTAGYTPVLSDTGTLLTIAVSGTNTGHASATRVSAPVGPVLDDVIIGPTPSVRVPNPGPIIGQTVEAIRGTWYAGDVQLVEADFTYTWFRSGELINNQSAKTYQLRSADVGKTISVRVSGTKAGYVTSALTSEGTDPVLGTLTAVTPSIRVPAVGALHGQTLEAVRGTWYAGGTALTEAAYSYAWYRDGVLISNQSGKTYQLRNADAGTSITVVVTVAAPDYISASRTSAPVAARF
jgi:hypothetical protein